MIVHDFNTFRTAVRPPEAQTKLVVDANGMLSRTIALESFQPITRWETQGLQPCRRVDLIQFALRNPPDIPRACAAGAFGVTTVEYIFGSLTGKRGNHTPSITVNVIHGNLAFAARTEKGASVRWQSRWDAKN